MFRDTSPARNKVSGLFLLFFGGVGVGGGWGGGGKEG